MRYLECGALIHSEFGMRNAELKRYALMRNAECGTETLRSNAEFGMRNAELKRFALIRNYEL